MLLLMQADGGITGTIIWFILFFVLIFLYPRLMLSQLIYSLEQSARKLEELSNNGNAIINKKIKIKDAKRKIDDFTDFFVVEPSSLDPYGIVKKVDQTIRNMEDRFDDFVEQIADDKNYDEKQMINYSLRAAIGLRQIAKIVRHNVELAKKFKNLQIAMIIQMQMPMIKKIAESEFEGTKAFIEGLPIGDSIGPMVAASMLSKSKEIAEDVMYGETKIDGSKCFILKAKGPAPHLGRIDEAIEKILKKNKIARVITIDAGLKLEGEKSGSVAEGVGFAMGGIGQREMIENVLLPKKIPLDSIVVKVGMEEAIQPMKKEIADSLPNVHSAIKNSIRRAKKGKVIIIGVGNSCGIGNDKKSLEKTNEMLKKIDADYKKKEAEKKKGGSWI